MREIIANACYCLRDFSPDSPRKVNASQLKCQIYLSISETQLNICGFWRNLCSTSRVNCKIKMICFYKHTLERMDSIVFIVLVVFLLVKVVVQVIV